MNYSDFIVVPDYGDIGAGSVVPFTPKGSVLIPRPPNTSESDFLFTHDVNGDSLYNPDNPSMSAYHGDRLICKAIADKSEIKNKVCIVFILPTCERIAKTIEIASSKAILRGLNPKYGEREYPIHDIEIKGIVLGVQHYW
jgi:hypothetical protein